jgi:hypothetical protein
MILTLRGRIDEQPLFVALWVQNQSIRRMVEGSAAFDRTRHLQQDFADPTLPTVRNGDNSRIVGNSSITGLREKCP